MWQVRVVPITAIKPTFMNLRFLRCCLALLVAVAGCRSRNQCVFDPAEADYQPYTQQIEYPDVESICAEGGQHLETVAPPSLRNPQDYEKWPLTLEETIRIALANSEVIHDVGGSVMPGAQLENGRIAQGREVGTLAPTVYDIATTEPSIEAALSAFDAQLTGQFFLQQQDRQANNVFAASSGLFTSEGDLNLAISKTAATGTQFKAENTTIYNRNRRFVPGGFNLFSSYYDTVFQAEVRHPLGQGGGLDFNRIAGPRATRDLLPSNYQGVLLKRIDSDVTRAAFEQAVVELLCDVETTYWRLYCAYREFEARLDGREFALKSWQLEKERLAQGNGTKGDVALAQDQFFLAEGRVQTTLAGIYDVERRLRSLLGLPTSDGRLIVPVDEPATVDVRFDWHDSLASALTRRVEVRSHRWTLKRRELELVAARNFEKMRVDLVAQYNWRGFGDQLFGSGNQSVFDPQNGTTQSVPISAFGSLFGGDLQDWRVGVEVTAPVGNRAGHAAVRSAELALTREHALHEALELEMSHQLRAAYTELDRALALTKSNYNRRIASSTHVDEEKKRNRAGLTRLDLVLDAEERSLDARINYYNSLCEYNIALMNVHLARGTLLDDYRVYLAEGPWSEEAHCSAAKLSRRWRRKRINYCMSDPPPISSGEYPQRTPETIERLPEPAADEVKPVAIPSPV